MEIFTAFQSFSDFFTQDTPLTIRVITYVISVVIGGVIYKYFNRWLEYRQDNKEHQQKASDSLIENMEQRIKVLGSRITDLESKREESYERELELTKMLAKAEQKVESLEDKVETLERNQKVMGETIDKYYKRYGPLDEIN